MLITELLKEDHQEAMRLIQELETADEETGTDPTYAETFNKLQQALKLHTRAEEEIFYPVMEGFDETRAMIQEAYQEHDQAEQVLMQLSTVAPNQDEFQDLLAELRDSLEHHVEEEENELFPKAEELCDQRQLIEMGQRFEAMKGDTKSVAATMKRR